MVVIHTINWGGKCKELFIDLDVLNKFINEYFKGVDFNDIDNEESV